MKLRAWLAFVALFVGLSTVYWRQDLTGYNTASVRAHGDGLYYYIYLRSLAFDRDVDFENDYRLIGNQFGFDRSAKTNKPTNPFTIGPALYWAPFLALAHTTLAIGNLFGWTADPLDGSSTLYQQFVFLGSVFWGCFALLLIYRMCLRYASALTAATATALIGAATPLTWFMVRQASFSHAISAFCLACFITYWHQTWRQRTRRQWGILGIFLGLAMLVRAQEFAHAIIALIEWAGLVWAVQRNASLTQAERKAAQKRHIVDGFAFVGGVCVGFLPQMIAWQLIYGYPLTIPQGGNFMVWQYSQWAGVLFSSRHGLFAWHPIIYVGVLGLLIAAVGQIRKKNWMALSDDHVLLAQVLLASFVVQVYINGATNDWWGGWAFGGRRFVSCSMHFAVGLCLMRSVVGAGYQRYRSGVMKAVAVATVLILGLCNIHLMDAYLTGRAKHGAAQSMAPVWLAGVQKAYDAIGNIGSVPMNWWVAWRTDAPPGRYDEISGTELFEHRNEVRINLFRGPEMMSGFSPASMHQDKPCRWIAAGHTGHIAFGLRRPVTMTWEIDLAASTTASKSAPSRVKIFVGRRQVLDTAVTKDWQRFHFRVEKNSVDNGLNFMRVDDVSTDATPRSVAIGHLAARAH